MNVNKKSALNNTMCSACLSTDRTLKPVVISQIQFLSKDLMLSPASKMCWECRAIVSNIFLFKKKVHIAQSLLNGMLKGTGINLPINLKCQSQLSTSKVEIYEVTYKHTYEDVLEVKDEYDADCDMDEGPIKVEVLCEGNDGYDDAKQTEHKKESGAITEPAESKRKSTKEISKSKEIPEDIDKEAVEPIENPEIKRDESPFITRQLTEREMLEKIEARRRDKKHIEREYKCEKCVLAFTQIEYNLHMKGHDENYGEHVCNICELRFKEKCELQTHIQKHYTWYDCLECDMGSDERVVMMDHYRWKHELRPRACKICGETIMTRYNFRLHKRRQHSRVHRCHLCEKSFSNSSYLKRHIQEHSAPIEMMECSVCHKKYKGEWGLRVHMKTHNAQPAENAYCVECDYHFKSVVLYRIHMKSNLKHVAQDTLKFKCPQCPKSFIYSSLLKNHMESVHSDATNHVCKECGKACKTSKALRSHMLFVHEGHERPKNKVCDVCAKAFTCRKTLLEHMNVHTGARPYKCEVCDATFGFAAARYTHKKLKHRDHNKTPKSVKRTENSE